MVIKFLDTIIPNTNSHHFLPPWWWDPLEFQQQRNFGPDNDRSNNKHDRFSGLRKPIEHNKPNRTWTRMQWATNRRAVLGMPSNFRIPHRYHGMVFNSLSFSCIHHWIGMYIYIAYIYIQYIIYLVYIQLSVYVLCGEVILYGLNLHIISFREGMFAIF